MLKELLMNNKVVFAHVQRMKTIDGTEKRPENYTFNELKSRYYANGGNEWVVYYDESEDGELSFDEPCVDICKTDLGDVYSFGIPLNKLTSSPDHKAVSGWVYAHDAEMLLVRLYDKKKIKYNIPTPIEGMERPEFEEEYTEIMLFFEENEYLKKYIEEIEDNKNTCPEHWKNPSHEALIDVMNEADEINDEMSNEELVERHCKVAEKYEAINLYRFAAVHYYNSYICSGQTKEGYSQSMLTKAAQMLDKMKQEGDDESVELTLEMFKALEKNRSKFNFDTAKEESSTGDVDLSNESMSARGVSTSEKPNVGKAKSTSARTLTNYTIGTLLDMASRTVDDVNGGHSWFEALKKECFNTMGWQNIYKPGAIKLEIETTWTPLSDKDKKDDHFYNL